MKTTTVGERAETLFMIFARPILFGWLTLRSISLGQRFLAVFLSIVAILFLVIGWNEFKLGLAHEGQLSWSNSPRYMKSLKRFLAFLLGELDLTKDPVTIRRAKSLNLWREAAERRNQEVKHHDQVRGIKEPIQSISLNPPYAKPEVYSRAGLGKNLPSQPC